jgi:site-specific recombinase XerD
MALEHGMDVKTLSTIIGHVSSATTLDIYSHVTDTMQKQAAVMIEEVKREIAEQKEKRNVK